MKELMLCGHPVRVDDQDMVCITDVWRAIGKLDKNRPNLFLQNSKIKDFADELSIEGNPSIRKASGRYGYTYVHKEVWPANEVSRSQIELKMKTPF